MLIRIVKNWTEPDLLRQAPGENGIWDGIQFTLDPVNECDALLVLNELREEITVTCPPENVWAVFQEPYFPCFFPWMRDRLGQFSRIYTHCPPNGDSRYRAAPPLVPWHVGRSYSELNGIDRSFDRKNDQIVWITSSSRELPGHLKRYAFYQFLLKSSWPDLDICGRGICPIEDKWDILTRARYAIAVENYFGDHYWTEKIADCWLAYTLPFYYGCSNLEKYFPADSFIRIDLADFDYAARTIRHIVDSGEYEKRLPAICEARDLVLNRHQFFPFMAEELRNNLKKSPMSRIQLQAYQQSPISRLKSCYGQKLHRLKVNWNNLSQTE